MKKPLIIDAHLDLAMNAMEWNRDLSMSIKEIRALEAEMSDKPDRANGTVSFQALRQGNIGLCVATLIARYVKPSNPLPGWNSSAQAWAQVQGQLAWYKEMIRQGHLTQLRDQEEISIHLSKWSKDPVSTAIGFILSLEGADSVVSMDHLHQLYDQGLRAIGPAHYGPGTYAFGTDSQGSIGHKGRELLRHVKELDIILDVTHLCDQSFWEVIHHFEGAIWASHSNCRSLVNHNRQFNDDQIKVIIERGGVIGLPLDAWMMIPDWVRGKSTPQDSPVSLNHMINHMDHICQIAGNCDHIMLGTDLDGGFGKEQCPNEIDTIEDLQKLPQLLSIRGFTSVEINKILSQNFVTFIGHNM